MKQTIARLTSIRWLSVIALFSIQMNAQSEEATAPTLAKLLITTDPKATIQSCCLQLLPDESITVYAVGLDERGNPFAISKDSVVHWAGDDVLEVKPTGSDSATVKLAQPLKASVAQLSARLTYDGKPFGSSVEIAQKVKELPKVWTIAFFTDPAAKKAVGDEEPVAADKPLTVYARGYSADMATMGEVFMIPSDASVVWKSVPVPPIGSEFKITPIGCFAAKIELVKKANPDFGFDTSGMIKIEVVDLPDGKTREGAFSVKIK